MIDARVLDILVCQMHRLSLELAGDALYCERGRSYPIVDGIPVLLPWGNETMHPAFAEPKAIISDRWNGMVCSVDSEDEPRSGARLEVENYVQKAIIETCGNLYKPLRGHLARYPIPEFPMPAGTGEALLDIGCNWGRWTISSARNGYRPIGIDPSLRSLCVARRIGEQLGINVTYIAADARHLPFKSESVDRVFSYSVIQHFSELDAHKTCVEVNRVLKRSGLAKIQMATAFGSRNLYQQARRRFKMARGFEVRYRRLTEIAKMFQRSIGTPRFEADGFFCLNPQIIDLDILPCCMRLIVKASFAVRSASHKLPFLLYCADSVYVTATKNEGRA